MRALWMIIAYFVIRNMELTHAVDRNRKELTMEMILCQFNLCIAFLVWGLSIATIIAVHHRSPLSHAKREKITMLFAVAFLIGMVYFSSALIDLLA